MQASTHTHTHTVMPSSAHSWCMCSVIFICRSILIEFTHAHTFHHHHTHTHTLTHSIITTHTHTHTMCTPLNDTRGTLFSTSATFTHPLIHLLCHSFINLHSEHFYSEIFVHLLIEVKCTLYVELSHCGTNGVIVTLNDFIYIQVLVYKCD